MAEIKAKLTSMTEEEEIRLLQEKIQELKREVDSMEKYKTYRTMADESYLIKKAFMDAGFTSKEAMDMILTTISNTKFN